MGSMAKILSGLVNRLLARSDISAISVPKITVLVAVIRPKNIVFHATPQLCPPDKQLKPKLRSVATRLHKAIDEKLPSSR